MPYFCRSLCPGLGAEAPPCNTHGAVPAARRDRVGMMGLRGVERLGSRRCRHLHRNHAPIDASHAYQGAHPTARAAWQRTATLTSYRYVCAEARVRRSARACGAAHLAHTLVDVQPVHARRHLVDANRLRYPIPAPWPALLRHDDLELLSPGPAGDDSAGAIATRDVLEYAAP